MNNSSKLISYGSVFFFEIYATIMSKSWFRSWERYLGTYVLCPEHFYFAAAAAINDDLSSA